MEVRPSSRERAVVAGAVGSLAAAGLHLAVLPFGPEGLRYFGAGKAMVELAGRGSPVPVVATSGIASALASAGLYALAQAGRTKPLPAQNAAYAIVTTVYLLRGAALFPQIALTLAGADIGPPRELTFSAVALTLGLLHAPGLRRPVRSIRPPMS